MSLDPAVTGDFDAAAGDVSASRVVGRGVRPASVLARVGDDGGQRHSVTSRRAQWARAGLVPAAAATVSTAARRERSGYVSLSGGQLANALQSYARLRPGQCPPGIVGTARPLLAWPRR